jgi:hypothetical protein
LPLDTQSPYTEIAPWLPLPAEQPNNSSSDVYENSRSCGGGGSRLFGFSGYSSNVAAQFILVFDTNRLPADGAHPVMVIPVAAASVFSAYFGSIGRWFSRGIVLCNSTTGPTKTIGVADTWFDVQYL